MKRFLSLLLAALMLMSFSLAHAETTIYKECGFTIDFSVIQEQLANYAVLLNHGVVIRELHRCPLYKPAQEHSRDH